MNAHFQSSLVRRLAFVIGAAALAASGCGGEMNQDAASVSVGGPEENGRAEGGGCATSGASPPASSGAGGGQERCDEVVAQAFRVPLDLLFLVDRSGSVNGKAWEKSKTAIGALVSDPASTGIAVGLGYFPVRDVPELEQCHHDWYEDPAVPVGPLPAGAPAIVESLDAMDTGGETPMFGALKGMLLTAAALKQASPGHEVAVVVATDGEAAGCGAQDDTAAIAGLAESAAASIGVETYVIGLDETVEDAQAVGAIAAAGGTEHAYYPFDTETASALRAAALGCRFAMPEPPPGAASGGSAIAVAQASPTSGALETVPRFVAPEDCGDGAGWFADASQPATSIVLCPASCAAAGSDARAELSVTFRAAPAP